MGREELIIQERLKKLQSLRNANIDPYPQIFEVKNYSQDIQEENHALKKGSKSKKKVIIAGRLMSIRDFGKIAFGVIRDRKGTIQIALQSGETPSEVQEFFKKYADSGDIFGVEGTIWRTERGELSVLVKKLTLLTKSLLPLPEKWHGLQDKEERYRKRYLDLIIDSNVKQVFLTREKIVNCVRSLLREKEFVEVETPVLQTLYGGASAAPFKTHLNALDMDLYLSISPELYLKRLVVGGIDRVFTICKNFRNEGIDYQHNPEFTMLEYYIAYKDYNFHIDFTEELFNRIRKDLKLGDSIEYRGTKISLKTPFKRITFRDLLLKESGIDINLSNDFNKLKKEIIDKKIPSVNISECKHYGALLDELYKRVARHKIIQPTFLTHYPVEMIALAKRNKEDSTKINSVQLIIDGAEVCKAYEELNDPLDQENRLKEQQNYLQEGDKSAMPLDEDFIMALKHGLPPTAGYGLGIDRLTMIFTGQESIRDVILFPFMRPEKTEVKK
ncbi:lysine--tRNA ligase [Candidatus Pacearchaeota archaeon]|nr:lysine--tRNA ligase [Candidatus Pacearchaeota archaeon]